MARLTGENTGNLAVPKFSQYDDVTKAALNEMIDKFDTRINIVADETQALNEHEADTTNVHGIADTSAIVATADTPADGEVLTYNAEGGVNWAAAATGGGVTATLLATRASGDIPNSYVGGWQANRITNATFDESLGELTLGESGLYVIDISLPIVGAGAGDTDWTFYLGVVINGNGPGYKFGTDSGSNPAAPKNVNAHLTLDLASGATIKILTEDSVGTRSQATGYEAWWSVLKIA